MRAGGKKLRRFVSVLLQSFAAFGLTMVLALDKASGAPVTRIDAGCPFDGAVHPSTSGRETSKCATSLASADDHISLTGFELNVALRARKTEPVAAASHTEETASPATIVASIALVALIALRRLFG